MDFPVWTSINQLRTIPVTPDNFDGTLRIAAANGTPSITLYIDHETESDANYLIAGTVRQDEDPDFDLRLELGSNMEFLGAKYQNHPVTEEFVCHAIAALHLQLSAFQWESLPSDRTSQAETAEIL